MFWYILKFWVTPLPPHIGLFSCLNIPSMTKTLNTFLSYRLPTLQDVLLWPREGSPKARTKSGHFSFFPNFLRFLNLRSDQSGYGGNIYSKWKRQFRIGVHGKHNWTGGFYFPGHQGCHMSFQNRILEMQCPRPLVWGCTSLKASN